MKKLFLTLIIGVTVALALTSCALTKSPADPNEPSDKPEVGTEGLSYQLLDDGTYAVSVGTAKKASDVVIPSTYNGKRVTAIPENGFAECTTLKNITIPDSITDIGTSAFYYCLKLESVHISDIEAWCKISFPDKTANPLYYAKQLCLGDDPLIDLEIPDTITKINDYAFYNCRNIKSVTVHDGITSIGNEAFLGCTGLTSVHITDIAKWCSIAFAESSNPLTYAGNLYLGDQPIADLVIPNGVTKINSLAFAGCTGITSVTVPAGVTEMGQGAFADCTGLTKVDISDVASWCNISFSETSNPLSYAKNLYLNGKIAENLIIPEGVTRIEDRVFADCTGIKSISIPSSLSYICSNSFNGCFGLEKVYIDDLTSWCNITFESSNANPLYHAKNLYLDGKLVTDLVIPDDVTSIGDYAFDYCTSLTKLTIPSNIEKIGYNTFHFCYNLLEVYNFSDIPLYAGDDIGGYAAFYAFEIYTNPNTESKQFITDDGFIFYKDTFYGNYLLGYVGDETDITLPESLDGESYRIHQHAFESCKSLASVSISGGADVTIMIGSYAFYNLNNLTNVTIGEGVTSIGNRAFAGCINLKTIAVGKDVTGVEMEAFSNCTGLTGVYITDLTSWCNIHFNSNPLTHAKNLYLNGELVTDLVIPTAVSVIGLRAFAGCTSITSLVIPYSVTDIDVAAFSGCSSLKTAVIGKNVKRIKGGAFYGCTNLTSVTFETTKNWEVNSNSAISSTDLSDTKKAAEYLSSKYSSSSWERS